jgi:hypothetical protein
MKWKWVLWWASLAYCTELFTAPGWHYFALAVPSSELSYILIEVQSSCPDRELLLADFSSSPTVSVDNATGLWDISSPYYEIEGWAIAKSHHFLSFLVPQLPL